MSDCKTEVRLGQRFAFGRNWQEFGQLIDEDRIRGAQKSLEQALGTTDLTGRKFLDVGCGSGLFSLAALRLGAQVRSFDYDPDSVSTAQKVRDEFAPGSEWVITCGSILDPEFVGRLGQFDIVYSWGVLHHTGALWTAMEATCGLVAPGGKLYVSIYNDQGLESRMWKAVKRAYNESGATVRRLLVAGSTLYLARHYPLGMMVRLAQGPRAVRAGVPRARGMSRKHDLIDWVGGYPFEVAAPEEVFRFCRDRGFELRHLKTCKGGIGCNEFVLDRT